MRTVRGYSLTELAITVAIVGILAAIAIPSWTQSQLRAKRAEVPPNVEGIRVAQMAYFAAFDTYVQETTWYPSDLSYTGDDRELTLWPSAESAGGFSQIGWVPHGQVRGRYSMPDGDEDSFEVQGLSNVDGDSEAALYWATETAEGGWDTGDLNIF